MENIIAKEDIIFQIESPGEFMKPYEVVDLFEKFCEQNNL